MRSGTETGHRPVYDRRPGGIFRGRLGRLKTLPPSPQVFYPSSNYGSTWNSGYWGGNYWGSGYWGSGYWGSGIYLGAGYYCDPFAMWTWGCYNPYAPFATGYPLFYFDPAFAYLFPAPFFSFSLFSGPYPYFGGYPFGYPSYSSLYYGGPFSSTVFGSSCPLCTTSTANFSLFTLDNPYLLTGSPLSPGSSASVTTGGTLSSADAASASSTANTSGPALFAPAPTGSIQPATVSGAKLPASKEPVSLVFSDGSTVQATQYWLADGKLHYVTVTGQSHAIPLGEFDMQATMKANQRNGVRFLPPASRQQKTEPKHS